MNRRRRSSLLQPLLLALGVGVIASCVYWFTSSRNTTDQSLTGTWVLTNQVTESSYRSYRDDTHEFRIEVVQEGEALKGRGEQSLYNGKAARNHYPLWFTKGEVKDGQVYINYRMNGSREFGGTFTLQVDPNDPTLLRGSFTSEAARTKGTTQVRILRD